MLLKTDSEGKIKWSKMYQSPGAQNTAYSMIQTQDGGFALAGFSGHSYLSSTVFNVGSAWLLKTDQNGGSSAQITSPPTPTKVSQNSLPKWIFNNAFAIYETTVNYSGITTPVRIKFTITNVDLASQTFALSTSYNGSIANFSSANIQVSLQHPTGLPAMTASDLSLLNNGNAPGSNLNAKVTTGVLVDVPGGVFTTDQMTINGTKSIWIDNYSGIMVKASEGLSMGVMGTTDSVMQLIQTNIGSETLTNSTETQSFPYYYLAGVAAAIVVVVVALAYFLKKRNRRTQEASVELG